MFLLQSLLWPPAVAGETRLCLILAAPWSCCFLSWPLCHSSGEMPMGTCSAILLHGRNQKGENSNISMGNPWPVEDGRLDKSSTLSSPGEQLWIIFYTASQSPVGSWSTCPVMTSGIIDPCFIFLFLVVLYQDPYSYSLGLLPPDYFHLVTGSSFLGGNTG